jgi:hypothetical protein
MECPICYENMDGNVNCMTTICGHKFHSNCLMQHTAHMGYTCPCCRNQMIEEPMEGDDEDEDEDEYDQDDLSDNDDVDSYVNLRVYSIDNEDEVLTSFRWFHQRLENETLEEDEFAFSESANEEASTAESEASARDEIIYGENKDQVAALVKRMKDINKLPYDKLLAAYLWKNCRDFRYNYYSEDMDFEVSRMINDVHTRMQQQQNVARLRQTQAQAQNVA